MDRKRTTAKRPEAVRKRIGSKPSIYLPVQDPGTGWGRVHEPMTGRQLLEALIQKGVDLDKPVEISLSVRHSGHEYLTLYTFHAHSASLFEEEHTLSIDFGEID